MDTPCIEWQGSKDNDGYGLVTKGVKGVPRAHRYAWEQKNGPIQNGLWVLHKCDNPSCVSIDHLYLGTAKDNTQDCIRKGRRNTPKGSGHHNSRITEEIARYIKNAPKGTQQKTLAEKYMVSIATISRIIAGKTWKHISDGGAI